MMNKVYNFSCNVCFELYTGDNGIIDRRPTVLCQNGHSFCAYCAKCLKDQKSCCPTCRQNILETPIINYSLIEAIEEFIKAANKVPQIPIDELVLDSNPFASGAFADVYTAKWMSQEVAVKVLRFGSNSVKLLEQLQLESNIVIGLHHPNVIRLFGTTKLKDQRFCIVMEKADQSSLDCISSTLDFEKKINISLGICDGLKYLHSHKIAHRDLKPQNILIMGSLLTPKIADFGCSRILQTMITNSAIVGTPKYAAPELLETGKLCGISADIFSLSMILYELFSGKQAEVDLGTNIFQIILSVVQGKRPTFDPEFSNDLKSIIQQGWSADASQRPQLDEFQKILLAMLNKNKSEETSTTASISNEVINKIATIHERSSEVSKVIIPTPAISLKWDNSCEVLKSREMRLAMSKDILGKSNMSGLINASILRAMEVVPRHLFLEKSRLSELIGKKIPTSADLIEAAYKYNKPICSTLSSNESSPEIIGTQLSLTEIHPGHSVLLVGVKGGYIQSLIAQIVGIHGLVLTVSSNKSAVDVCRDRIMKHSPLKENIDWEIIDNITKCDNILSAIQKKNILFNSIIYCGATNSMPLELVPILHPSGSILVPVKLKENSQQFQLLQRKDGVNEITSITQFGVIFEDIK